MNAKNTGMLIAATIASLIATTGFADTTTTVITTTTTPDSHTNTATANPPFDIPGMVHGAGVNSCKGLSNCKTTTNACKTLNACKGQGWLSTTTANCKQQGGTVIPSN